jgi:hypothetical protein
MAGRAEVPPARPQLLISVARLEFAYPTQFHFPPVLFDRGGWTCFAAAISNPATRELSENPSARQSALLQNRTFLDGSA